MHKLPCGTQIIRRTGKERDEAGFVTSGPTMFGGYYCRFWRMNSGGVAFPPELRTKNISELVIARHIIVEDSLEQVYVDQALEKYCGKRP